MVDIIAKKRDGLALSQEEITFFVKGYTSGQIPDYQASALTMAIVLQGMGSGEIAHLTMEMARSGDMVDLSGIAGIKVDKHSTGGVGDKTTLVVAPLVAALGVPVAKMSGQGLGHTGGTVDKLESIPGYRTALSRSEFLDIVSRIGISIAGQSGNLAPADKKLYALRDVTATVESNALIAASIMSKKIAAGADAIVLDVKCGSGAFLKSREQARELALEMVRIGENVGRQVVALITDMDVPLGHAVGNSLEVIEAVKTLKGEGPRDLTDLCVEIAANMLLLGEKGDVFACRKQCEEAILDGRAFAKLLELVQEQGGEVGCLTHPERLPQAEIQHQIAATQDGYITHMDCQQVGTASMLLGAGRETKDSGIDYGAGIVLLKKTGDFVKKGEAIAKLYTGEPGRLEAAGETYLSAVTWGKTPPRTMPLVLDRVDHHTLQEVL